MKRAEDDPAPRPRLHRDVRSDDTTSLHPFLAACLLTVALILPHTRATPVASGLVLAGAIRWGWLRLGR